MARKKPLPAWRVALNKIGEYWKMIVGGLAILGMLSTGALVYADIRHSDAPPLASIKHVERVAHDAEKKLAQVQKELVAAVQQLRVANGDSAQSWCEFYRKREAEAHAHLAVKPDDDRLQDDLLEAQGFKDKWCKQALAAPAP
jgi:hypothetical protein